MVALSFLERKWCLSKGRRIASISGMAGWKDIREIAAWRMANDLKCRVDRFLERDEVKRKFRFCDQLAGSARSGPSNIAEGFGRFGNKEFARFARIAKASQVEVLNHLIDARDQRLLSEDDFLRHEECVRTALKATVGLIRHLESTSGPPTKPTTTEIEDPEP